MSEIEKLYRNAGISMCTLDFRTQYTTCDYNTCNGKQGKVSCGWYVVPPLAPEKQLGLIKWLGKSRPIHITFLCDEWNIESMVRYGKRYNTFENALCGYTNAIWQDLTETERNEIQDILKE